MITNYDHCLRFEVNNKRMTCLDVQVPEVVAENRGCICIHIDFDEQWDGVGKVARFIYEGKWADVVLDVDGECICPSEVIKKGRFLLGVYGADLKSTTPIAVTVAESILSASGEELPADPEAGIYEQILTQYQILCEEADEASKAAWAAIEQSADAVESLNKAKEELELGGFITGIKERNHGNILSFWVGTSEEYKKLAKTDPMCLYIVTDDEVLADVERKIKLISDALAEEARKRKQADDDLSGAIEGVFNSIVDNDLGIFNVGTATGASIYGSVKISETQDILQIVGELTLPSAKQFAYMLAPEFTRLPQQRVFVASAIGYTQEGNVIRECVPMEIFFDENQGYPRINLNMPSSFVGATNIKAYINLMYKE